MAYTNKKCVPALLATTLVAMPAFAAPYLATITRVAPVLSWGANAQPSASRYFVNVYNLGAISRGGWSVGVPFSIPYAACVASTSKEGSFWVLVNRAPGRGSAIFKYTPVPLPSRQELIRSFSWRSAAGRITAPLMVGQDRSVWIWSLSRKTKSYALRIFSRNLSRLLGACILPTSDQYVAAVLADDQTVVFSSSWPSVKNCKVLVVQEDGKSKLTDLTSKVGWHPKYLAATGSLVSGMTPSGKLMSFRVLPGGTITSVHVVKVVTPRKQGYIVSYATLNQNVGFCVVQSPKYGEYGNSYGIYKLAKIFLKTGKVIRTVVLPSFSQGLFVSHGLVYFIANSGTIYAYTPSLRFVGRQPPETFSGLISSAVSPTN